MCENELDISELEASAEDYIKEDIYGCIDCFDSAKAKGDPLALECVASYGDGTYKTIIDMLIGYYIEDYEVLSAFNNLDI